MTYIEIAHMMEREYLIGLIMTERTGIRHDDEREFWSSCVQYMLHTSNLQTIGDILTAEGQQDYACSL